MSNFRKRVYGDIIEANGWNNMSLKHNKTLLKFREMRYRTYKFYNQTLKLYNSTMATYASIQYIDMGFFIINAALCSLGIIGYKLVKRCKILNNLQPSMKSTKKI